MDSILSMDNQIAKICQGAWHGLRCIGNIRSFLTEAASEKLVHAFVSSKLDSNNGLLYGLPKEKLKKLQKVQNAAARMVSRTPKHDHITPVLKSLHWLPISERIEYKILLLTYKSLTGKAPAYLQQLLKVSHQDINVRSNDLRKLLLPRPSDSRYGDRCFEIAAPTLWNALPLKIRQCETVESFKKNLKTYLFKCAYE